MCEVYLIEYFCLRLFVEVVFVRSTWNAASCARCCVRGNNPVLSFHMLVLRGAVRFCLHAICLVGGGDVPVRCGLAVGGYRLHTLLGIFRQD